jgi:hypothetical protein
MSDGKSIVPVKIFKKLDAHWWSIVTRLPMFMEIGALKNRTNIRQLTLAPPSHMIDDLF